MKSFKTEFNKPKIWIDSGLMIALEDNDVSSIFYKKGFFRKWKIINSETIQLDLERVLNKLENSSGKLGKSFMPGSIGKPIDVSKYRFVAKTMIKQLLYV